MAAIRKVAPQGLPEHVRVIGAEDKLNTFSLFQVLDYCLTVRGTVGIETSALGIRTLTAGTGRYDRHGFTKDFRSTNDYLRQLCTLHELPPPTKEEIESWIANCPIKNLETYMSEKNIIDEKQKQSLCDELIKQIKENFSIADLYFL